jgi:anti-anti-sigma factor
VTSPIGRLPCGGMDLTIATTRVGREIVLSLSGIADLSTIPALQDRVQRSVSDHPGNTLVIDVDGLLALDDTALGLFLGAAARARQAGGELVIVCSNDRLRRRLALTRLDQLVTIRSAITAHTQVHEKIFHIALPDDWAVAQTVDEYRISTRRVTLEQEGFIHCSRRHQLLDVANRFYSDVDYVVLLHIDQTRIVAEVKFEPPAPGTTELFPHIYGPIPTRAVTQTTRWERCDDSWELPANL